MAQPIGPLLISRLGGGKTCAISHLSGDAEDRFAALAFGLHCPQRPVENGSVPAQDCSPDGAQRNPGAVVRRTAAPEYDEPPNPDCAALHPGYEARYDGALRLPLISPHAPHGDPLRMKHSITSAEFDFLADRAGLTLTAAQKAELMGVYPLVAAFAERVRTPRGREAEPAHVFIPGESAAS
jgi:hypothetical protein